MAETKKKSTLTEAEQAYIYVCRLLTRKEYTIHEIRKKLWNKEFGKEVVRDTIGEFIRLGYLDDEKYVGKYVRTRLNLSPRGEFLLRMELKRKGVKEEIIDKYFFENPVDEIEAAQEFLRRKERTLQRLEPSKRRTKTAYFLKSKGFKIDTQRKILYS
ncbi:regulatory protein RecX [Candidatus Peregrinibacteria bacterium]|jgi:regulatory protein|nr:regulatory protein RecX [Candidatus Peregrinibacteria bacterium]